MSREENEKDKEKEARKLTFDPAIIGENNSLIGATNLTFPSIHPLVHLTVILEEEAWPWK